MPKAKNFPKLSGAERAILTALQNNNANIVIIKPEPQSPASSPMIAKIESFVASGR